MKQKLLFMILFASITIVGTGCLGTKGTPSSSTASSAVVSSSSSSIISSSSSSLPRPGRYPNYNTSPKAPDLNGVESTAQQIVSRLKLGWNLGNTMEASGGETAWGNPSPTKQLMQLVKQQGFDAVRLPISYDQYANQTTAEIDSKWLSHVRAVVQYAVESGLYVLVNIHWDGGWLEENVNNASKAAVNDKQHAFWTQIANTLRDFDEHVMFGSANEPNVETTEQMSVLLSYHQTFINAVRATGGKNSYRVLVVQGPSTSAERTNQMMNSLPSDPATNRMIVEVHSYTPYQFTLMIDPQDWGFTAYPFFYWGNGNHSNSDTQHNPTWGEESEIDKEMGWMKQKFVSKGIPVILGEYAAMRRNDQVPASERNLHSKSRAYWHKYVTQKALENGVIPFYWDAGGLDKYGSGIFNRNNYTVFDQETLTALKQGAGKL